MELKPLETKFWVFGAQGMLGQQVMQLAGERGHQTIGFTHQACPIESPQAVAALFGTTLSAATHEIPNFCLPDVIINCAGVIPNRPAPPSYMAAVNGVGPYNLAELAGKFDARLVQMSTDCVFSGRTRPHPCASDDYVDPIDVYGRSKLLGEVRAPHVTVVRGSFIGMGEHGLLNWLLHESGIIDAWKDAYWNGTSVKRMAGHLLDIALDPATAGKLLHVAARAAVSKAALVQRFVEALDLPVSLAFVDKPRIWRVLEPNIETVPVMQAVDELVNEVRATWETASLSVSP